VKPALAIALLTLPGTALAQASNCTIPQRVEPVAPSRPDGPVRRVAVASYTLAASWSPEYCRNRRGDNSMQCGGSNGRFGFILHGLWPEARKGAPPQWCRSGPAPTPQVLRRHLCMTPSARLLEHEWAKHGSCMVKKPETYFRVSQILWNSIRWPDARALSRENGLTAGQFRRAFMRLNPAWKGEMIGMTLSRNGWLREVRLCYGRDFMPAPCAWNARGAGDASALKIWRGR